MEHTYDNVVKYYSSQSTGTHVLMATLRSSKSIDDCAHIQTFPQYLNYLQAVYECNKHKKPHKNYKNNDNIMVPWTTHCYEHLYYLNEGSIELWSENSIRYDKWYIWNNTHS